MEAVPRLPMISFNLKTSPESAAFAPKLKQYIAEFYHEDPESYNNEFHALEGLRAVAVRPAKDVTGCSVLKRYYAQLHALQGRFPMEKGQPMAIAFTWKDIYTSSCVSANDIRFEMGAVLYNIGALHSQLGAADSRNSADGMKLACTHFQCAAWAFQHLRENYCQVVSEDLCSELMTYMTSLSFAQAQECILEKSMADNRKATIVARIAVQVVDYYSMALAALLTGGDDGPVADTVGSKTYKEWKKYIQFKIAYCGCVSLLYQGQQAEEQQKMGERVAFYQASFNRLEEAIKLAKGMPNTEIIADALNFTNDVVEGKRKAAKNENEFIYHEEVPEMSALTQATGAPLVKGIPFSVTDKEVLGEDIFKRLVPLSAHEASSVYSEEKAQLLRDIGNRIETADMTLQTHLSALHLLGLQSLDDSIPQALIDRCAALSAHPDTTQEITQAMDLLADTSSEVQTQLLEIQKLLEQEDENEKIYVQSMGTRPVNSVIMELTREFAKYKEANAKAESSNDTLRRAMSMHINNLQILAQPLDELQAALPKIKEENVLDEGLKKKLQDVLNKVEEMRKQRINLYNQFREATLADDITAKLVAWGDKPAEELFQKELQKHKNTVALLDQNIAAQDNILKALTESYAECAPFLKHQMEVMRKREHFCASLVASYDAYEDLLAKMSKGTDFYKKLHANVSKLLARVKSVSNVQQEERIARLQTKSNPIKSQQNNTSNTKSTGSTPKLKDYLAAGYGTDSYRVPGVRPRPLGSEGTTDLSIDNASTNYTNTYYQGVNMGSVPSNTQVYQTDMSSYNSMNYYNDYLKFGLQQPINQEKAATPNLYNYQQYSQSISGLPTVSANSATTGNTINFQSLANNSQDNFASKPLQYVNPPNSTTNVQVAASLSNITHNSSNTQNILPQCMQSLPTNNQVPNIQQLQTPNGQNLALDLQKYSSNLSANPIPSSLPADQYHASTSNAQSYNPVPYSTSQLNPNLSTNCLNNQNYTSNYQSTLQSFDKTNYTATQQMAYNQNYNLAQQMSDLSLQNISNPTVSGSYNTLYQPNQLDIKTSNTSLASPSNLQYNQSMSYTGHPGYAYDSNTGTYQYSSGYQNMQGYSNQPTIYASNYGDQAASSSQNWPAGNYQYTNAGNNPGTIDTLSSQAGHQGQSYAQQYASNIPQVSAEQYYMQMYGATGTGSIDGSSFGTPSAMYPLTPQSPMTYMNSGATMTNTTYSQDSSNSNQNNPATVPKQSSGVQSNVDLLAGLDFSSSVPILTPEQNSVLDKKPEINSKNLISADTVEPSGISTTKANDDTCKDVLQNNKQKQSMREEIETESVKTEQIIENEKRNKLLDLQQIPTKENLVRFLHEVERQEKYLEGISTKTLNGPTPLESKWKELQDLLAMEHASRSISVARCYPAKNRSPDHLPFDQTRVLLDDSDNDYINASYMKNLPTVCPDFIITQAPLNNTIADFWSVVWNKSIETIVCLLPEKELDISYFPTQKDSPLIFGNYKITLQAIIENEVCIERVMSIKGNRDKPPRDFLHLQVKCIPKSCEIICGIANEVVSCYQKQKSITHPVLIHCLNGDAVSGIVVYAICAVLFSKASIPCLLDSLNIFHLLSSQRNGIFCDRLDLLLAMEAEVFNSRIILNGYNLMTSYQIQNKAKSNIPSPQEVTVKDPFGDIDPLWKIRKT